MTLSLNYHTTNKGRKSAEDWLREVGYSEEEITKIAIGTFNGAVFGRKKYAIPDTPSEYMACSSFCLKHFEIPEELLKVFPKISMEISKMEETFHTIKKTEKTNSMTN